MAEYEKLYYKAFNAITDIIEVLKKLQQELEEEFLASCEENSGNEE